MELRKNSEHGLGHLLNPLNPADPEDQSRDWIKEIWRCIVLEALGELVSLPGWMSQPAVSRETASSPMVLERLTPKRRKRLAYAERIKPMNFLLTVHVHPLGYPADVDRTEFRLIAPFTRDASKWLGMRWTEAHSGETFAITTSANADSRLVRVKSYRDVFADYLTHPEPKSAAADGSPCSRSDVGLLNREPVFGTRIIYTGKESNRYEDVENESIESWDEVRETFEDQNVDPWTTFVLPILKLIRCSDLSRQTGKSKRFIKALRNGTRQPSSEVKQVLTRIAADFARGALDEQIVDQVNACAAFLPATTTPASEDRMTSSHLRAMLTDSHLPSSGRLNLCHSLGKSRNDRASKAG